MNDQRKTLPLLLILCLGALVICLIIEACGARISEPSEAGSPSISSINPPLVIGGASAAKISVLGSGFTTQSEVSLNSKAHSSIFVSSTQIDVPLSSQDLAVAGNYTISVANPPGQSNVASATFSIWQPVLQDSTGLSFAVPPFGSAYAMSVDTTTSNNPFVNFKLTDSSGNLVSEFAFTIYDNSGNLSPTQWFEQNVDVSGVLLGANAFQQTTLADGAPAFVFGGTIPDQFYAVGGGPPINDAYKFTTTGQVIGISQSPVNDLSDRGYASEDSIVQLETEILGTAHF
jgi:hypothetical protein